MTIIIGRYELNILNPFTRSAWKPLWGADYPVGGSFIWSRWFGPFVLTKNRDKGVRR